MTVRDVDGLTALEAFRRLQTLPGCCWLDSANPQAPRARWSIVTAAPWGRFTAGPAGWQWSAGGRHTLGHRDGLRRLQALLDDHLPRGLPEGPDGPLPFGAGAIGCLQYEVGQRLEGLPSASGHLPPIPEITVQFYAGAYVFDHHQDRAWAVGSPPLLPPGVPEPTAPDAAAVVRPRGHLQPSPGRAAFLKAVAKAREYIADGDIYQVNLAQRFAIENPPPATVLYEALRQCNPAPFAAFMDLGDACILSSSPERLLRRNGSHVETCPIKGTRPRATDPTTDATLRRALEASPKERAELLMIVDLLRNDLGRVCEYGSVEVREPGAIETYATVHHRVAEVIGRLRPEIDWATLLAALLPGGSITGAPKTRAMQVIRELEADRREVFCGNLGYFATPEHGDWNIAIRTIVHAGDFASFHAGAGIVWDSEAAAEFDEILAKAEGLRRAVFGASSPRPTGSF